MASIIPYNHQPTGVYTHNMPLEPPNLEPSDEDGPGAHEAWRLRQLELHRDMGSARVGGARVEVDPGTSEQSWMLGMIWKKK